MIEIEINYINFIGKYNFFWNVLYYENMDDVY